MSTVHYDKSWSTQWPTGEPDGSGGDAGVPGPDPVQLVQGHEDKLPEEHPGQAGHNQPARSHHGGRKHQRKG